MERFRAEIVIFLSELGISGNDLLEAEEFMAEEANEMADRREMNVWIESRKELANIRRELAMQEAKNGKRSDKLVEDRAGATEVAADELG